MMETIDYLAGELRRANPEKALHPEEEITEPTSPHILPKGAGAHGNR